MIPDPFQLLVLELDGGARPEILPVLFRFLLELLHGDLRQTRSPRSARRLTLSAWSRGVKSVRSRRKGWCFWLRRNTLARPAGRPIHELAAAAQLFQLLLAFGKTLDGPGAFQAAAQGKVAVLLRAGWVGVLLSGDGRGKA